MKRFADKKVAAVFQAYPPKVRAKLMDLRELVFGVAEATDGVGPLDETLKWGQPSYLTAATGSGSTIRLDRLKKDEGYALYLLLDCKREMPSLTEVPLESSRLSVGEPVFQIDTRDLSFLRSIGIDPTRRLRRRRPSRAL